MTSCLDGDDSAWMKQRWTVAMSLQAVNSDLVYPRLIRHTPRYGKCNLARRPSQPVVDRCLATGIMGRLPRLALQEKRPGVCVPILPRPQSDQGLVRSGLTIIPGSERFSVT